MLTTFTSSVSSIALSEIGDKTQLLTLFLAARFPHKKAIVFGIFVATLLNHMISALIGTWLAKYINPELMNYLVGFSFIIMGIWLLIPDKEDSSDSRWLKYGAFTATTILFFVGEIGDKTQIATVLLAAKYDSFFWVVAGSVVGVMIANVPVVYFGQMILNKIPLRLIRLSACVVFFILGIITLF